MMREHCGWCSRIRVERYGVEMIYRFGDEVLMGSPISIYGLVSSGQVWACTVRDDNGFVSRVRAFRLEDDEEGTIRLYNNSNLDNVQIAANSLDWVQIPNLPIDVFVNGDLLTGTMVFRAHVDLVPVS